MDRTQGQPGQDEQPVGRPAGALETRPPAAVAQPLAPARVVTLTTGEFTLTVNPVDGSEIEPLRPDAREAAARRPARRDAAARAARDAAARPPALPGPPVPALPLLGRADERERLVRLLGRGRSVRLTGPAGSGRSTLLDAVAADCADLAPDGVVRLSGHGRQQPAELLHTLYTTVYDTRDERPDRTRLLAGVAGIGAIVLLDDLELGGPALDELFRATPECAYLLAATPDTKAPSDDAHLEEVFLGGLGRADCLRLLEAATGRALTDEETAWAEDLRFASEGLPLRFVQAAALLRQRDELNDTAAADEDEEPGVFEERPRDPSHVPLPTLAQAAAPAGLLASRVSESARAALRTACALAGELPHHAHLPALVGDTHADAAVAELLGCGLITPVGPRYRLAEGVARQLEEAGYGETAAEEARTAARHYAWWTGHASVTPERVAAEADAVLAALAGADVVAAVLLARTAAPALAAAPYWEAWQRVLRSGAEAARKAGEVAEQAYFHHELGVLALCEGRLERARAELEASIGLRGALADKRGTVSGRRALALVTDRDRAATAAKASPPLRLEAPPALPPAGPAAQPPSQPAPRPTPQPAPSEAVTRVTPGIGKPAGSPTSLSQVYADTFTPAPAAAPLYRRPRPAAGGRRKTVLLAAAGALTVVALGTVVGLSLTAGGDDPEQPAAPAVSSTPDTPAVVPPQVPGNSGNGSAPEPAAPPPAADPNPGGGHRPTPPPAGHTPGPQQPQPTPPAPKPTPETPKPDPDPDPEPPVTSPPPPTSPAPTSSAPTTPTTSSEAQSPTAAQSPTTI
ncbi:ATP-binding protein [Streptomyces sp. NPDC012794]|uniref:ATP-binding protein n=1 Tax=Streptomyces sp. NPDC012794 TaxID=3364850 RepID=UPI0036CCF9DA